MHHRPFRRAAALALGAVLAFAGTASADTVLADGDVLTTAIEGTKHLEDVPPAGTVSADVRFVVTCAGISHVDAGQSVVLGWSGGGTVPLDGAIVSVASATLSPLTTAWATDSQGCPDPVPTQEGGATSHVTLRAPTVAGMHTFTISWDRSLQPAGNNDGAAFSRSLTSVSFTLRVTANQAPNLTVPPSFTVEGNTIGGWAADWSGVSATDAEDSPDPSPTCSPAAGSVLSVGETSVSCSVTDLGGASDHDSFVVTVVDTTAPILAGMPSDVSVETGDASGTTVTFADPTATDVVDGAPAVACAPASGSHFLPGTTTVTCMASDASGNSSSASFDFTVQYVAPPLSASATWLEPIAGHVTTFLANRGRTIPVKVRLFVDGVERTAGDAALTLTPCGGGAAVHLPLQWNGTRWNVSLDTSRLAGPCYAVTATIDDLVAGSFTLELRGIEMARAVSKRTIPTATRPFDRISAPPSRKGR